MPLSRTWSIESYNQGFELTVNSRHCNCNIGEPQLNPTIIWKGYSRNIDSHLKLTQISYIMPVINKQQTLIDETSIDARYMNAIALTRFPGVGGVADIIEMVKTLVVHPKPNEVVIQQKASSLHIDEIYAAQGTALGRFFGPKLATADNPHILGSSVSGVIVELGKDISHFSLGDEVIVIPDHQPEAGAWVQYKCFHKDRLMVKPSNMSHVEAAAITVAACVAWGAIGYSNAKVNDQCLVVGASGSIGAMVLQYLHILGCKVTAVCSERNVETVIGMGADKAVDYTLHNFANDAEISGTSYDYVFDCVGGKDVEHDAFRALKRDGSFITIVGPIKYIGERKLSWPEVFKVIAYVLKRMFTTRFYGPRYIFCGIRPCQTIEEALCKATEHNLKMPIDRIIPFEVSEVSNAVRILMTHRAKGRIVIDFTS